MAPVREPHLRDVLNILFVAFPQRKATRQDQAERKQQYNLYHQRLGDLPVGLVHAAVLELVDSSRYLPRIGEIRSLVRARLARRATLARPMVPESENGRERARMAQTLSTALHAGKSAQGPVTGSCSRVRSIDGERQTCGRPYEYTPEQAAILRANRESLLCRRCAGEYLKREGRRKHAETAWALGVLAELSPSRRPTPSEVQRLHAYGFGVRLQERLIEIGAYSGRVP